QQACHPRGFRFSLIQSKGMASWRSPPCGTTVLPTEKTRVSRPSAASPPCRMDAEYSRPPPWRSTMVSGIAISRTVSVSESPISAAMGWSVRNPTSVAPAGTGPRVMVADSAAIQTNDTPPAQRSGTLQPERGGGAREMAADPAATQTKDTPPAERSGTLQPEPGGVVSKSKASRPGSADDWGAPRQAAERAE